MGPADSTDSTANPRPRAGRPLDHSRDRALREAALALLAEVGYDLLTMEAVAARAGAGKTTLYRRWAGKAELVVDVLNGIKGDYPVPDTGSLREDLYAMAATVIAAENDIAAVTIGILNALGRDAALRDVFREKFVTPRSAAFRTVFDRAVVRGEMEPGYDLDLLTRLIPALGMQRLVTSGELPDARWAVHVIDSVLYPLATCRPPVAESATHVTLEGETR